MFLSECVLLFTLSASSSSNLDLVNRALLLQMGPHALISGPPLVNGNVSSAIIILWHCLAKMVSIDFKCQQAIIVITVSIRNFWR